MTFTVKDVLTMEVAPALGCTDPIAIALGAAAAASVLPDEPIESIDVWVDPNIYKNGVAVVIPGTGGLIGLDKAAALGALGGDPSLKLEVLASLSGDAIQRARKLLREDRVQVQLLPDRKGIFIRVRITTTTHTAESVIEAYHDAVVSLLLDNEPVADSQLLAVTGTEAQKDCNSLTALEAWLKDLSLNDLLDLVDDLDEDDLNFLERGIETNMELAAYGLKHGSGLGIGRALERLVRQGLIKKDMITTARILASAAADARMAGAQLPAMSSAGSGNHGLTAILPIAALRDFVEIDRKTLLEAVGLSHIVTGYIKAYTGRLSAVCGCSAAAGAGAAAGITYLLGGTISHIAGAIKNLIEDLAGVICDGAKAGCALKLATAAGTAVQAALFSLHGVVVEATDGIVGVSPEDTMRNVGTLTTEGMIETDRTILNIMLQKEFSKF